MGNHVPNVFQQDLFDAGYKIEEQDCSPKIKYITVSIGGEISQIQFRGFV